MITDLINFGFVEFGLGVKFKCLCLKFELAHGNRSALSWLLFIVVVVESISGRVCGDSFRLLFA